MDVLSEKKQPVVTFTILRYSLRYRYRAFANMGRWIWQPFQTKGLGFQKLMGSGKSFGLIPDFSTYVFLAVWDTPEAARQFFTSAAWSQYVTGTTETGTLWLQPLRSHGSWDGSDPFPKGQPIAAQDAAKPILVLTRATIRTGALLDFWRYVPQARAHLKKHDSALLFAIGVGEKPVVQQCTISIWNDPKVIEQFAYRQSGHKEIVQRTRTKRWYKEELFARFVVIDSEGFFANILDQTKQKIFTETN
ncbi:DUF3291 domain-containing protein [Tellurirhabdus bombi]|uniref:DUF3291 domain-containing protein n=1 Tax=Tellurirhabdus bombi TaxID=2907205 RepID=UPI001F238D0C|nr:DUF3291 domain-containing protein [Tellurirhabdus bombi]